MIPRMYKKILSIILLFSSTFLLWYFIVHHSFLFENIYKPYYPTKDSIKYQYGVIIDAGSSGSRLFIYTWPPHSGNSEELLQIKPLTDNNNKPIVKKVNPGLSSFADNPEKAAFYIKPLLDLAVSSIPKSQHKETPFYLMATAGMRMISDESQTAILKNVRKFVKENYDFLFSESHAKVITGKEEGIYGWITTNYLLGRFNHNHSDGVPIINVPYSDSLYRSKQVHHRKSTVGVIDMGGGSMQIAYELDPNSMKEFDSAVTFNLGCRENDIDHTYKVFVTTFLGFGANSARTRYERMLVRDHIEKRNITVPLKNTTDITRVTIEDPCLHKGLEVTQLVRVVNDTQGGLVLSSKELKKRPSVKAIFTGTGKYHQCESKTLSVLNKKPCSTESQPGSICTISGRLHPPIDLVNTQFYGFSEYWYSMHDIFGLGGQYNFFALHSAAVEYCSKDWVSLSIDFKKGLYKEADMPRMKYQCFKAAWITSMFHHGLGFPNAYNKFISVEQINGAEVQWSLGALLYQTRYFPLRQIEQKKQDQKKQEKEGRNRPKTFVVYFCLFLAVSMVFVTIYWIHNRNKLQFCWPNFPHRKDQHKNSVNIKRYSSDDLLESMEQNHQPVTIREFRSSPNFKNWT